MRQASGPCTGCAHCGCRCDTHRACRPGEVTAPVGATQPADPTNSDLTVSARGLGAASPTNNDLTASAGDLRAAGPADGIATEEEVPVQVRHLKAHVAKSRLQNMEPEKRRHTQGNHQADYYAKEGADLDANFACAETLSAAGDKVQWALRYVACQQVQARLDGWEDTGQVQRKRNQRLTTLEVGPAKPHQLVRASQHGEGSEAKRWTCARCGAGARSQHGRQRLMREECRGVVIASLFPHTGSQERLTTHGPFSPNGHRLMRTGRMFWCDRCGCYAVTKCIGLKKPCVAPKDGEPTGLARLRAGLHPATKATLCGNTSRVTRAVWEEALQRGDGAVTQ